MSLDKNPLICAESIDTFTNVLSMLGYLQEVHQGFAVYDKPATESFHHGSAMIINGIEHALLYELGRLETESQKTKDLHLKN